MFSVLGSRFSVVLGSTCIALVTSCTVSVAGGDSESSSDDGAENGLGDALHQAVTLYYGRDGVAGGEPSIVDIQCAAEEGSGCCGAMKWETCNQVGASVVVYDSYGGSGCDPINVAATLAHEMGHNLGMAHDSEIPSSFMNSGGQYKNADVSAGNRTQAEEGLEEAECGRRPGFEWIGEGNECGACP